MDTFISGEKNRKHFWFSKRFICPIEKFINLYLDKKMLVNLLEITHNKLNYNKETIIV